MNRRLFPRRVGRVFTLLATLALVGCTNPTTAPISGTIQLKGKTPNLEGLSITFLGPKGVPVMLPIQPDGTYQGQAPLGEAQVGFSWVAPNSEAALEQYARAVKPVEEGMDQEIDPKSLPRGVSLPELMKAREAARGKGDTAIRFDKSPLPEKVLDPMRSGIKTTIQAGIQNTFDHDIR